MFYIQHFFHLLLFSSFSAWLFSSVFRRYRARKLAGEVAGLKEIARASERTVTQLELDKMALREALTTNESKMRSETEDDSQLLYVSVFLKVYTRFIDCVNICL